MTGWVVDASAIVDLLVRGQGTEYFDVEAHVPSHALLEAASALCALERRQRVSRSMAQTALADLLDLPLTTWEVDALLPTAWRLRHELSLYDGLYVALAAHLDLPLVTLDGPLRATAVRHCAVLESLDEPN